ncbi:hypothetical protein ZIOFF_037541 [Zingiber officinale]|uniref:Uncharacterized protein n=1 Tax=Zingiber officinale TaxID=94328 RepID=A0A8J5GSA4_ZINOF|nr:hypothetical protein ZIOFF_037541 [Zingiber officinale]
MLQSRKPVPNLDQQSTKALNLTVLQRADAFVEEILLTATHVALYAFSVEINQWVHPFALWILLSPLFFFSLYSRKEVEGSLFVVMRNTQPRFQFIVMNRRNADNLVEDLLGDFEYEVQMPYLLYCNASQEINGIWFYDSHECEAVANLFSRYLVVYIPFTSKLFFRSPSLVRVAFARQIDADVGGNSNERKTGMRDWRGAAAKKVSTLSFLDLDLEGWSLEHSTLDLLPLPDQLTHIVEHGLGQNPSQDGNAASLINSVRQSPYLLALVEEGSMILEKAIIYK